MTKLLTIDEMLAVLHNINHPSVSVIRASVERIADQMGDLISEALGVDSGAASYEMDCGGTCVPFYAKRIGQPCPEHLMDFDSTEWTDSETTPLDPSTGAPQ